MAELPYLERIDDSILVAASRLARLRSETLRGAIEDFRASCVEMVEDDSDRVWRDRIDRANALLFREDAELRKMTAVALERER
jgi:hypothetical protein